MTRLRILSSSKMLRTKALLYQFYVKIMPKKLILLLCIGAINICAHADDTSNNFMLMNNYNVRQTQDIWQRMREGFRLQSATDNQRVSRYEKLYTKNQATFNKLMKNAYPYLYYVLTQTERYGLPSELALVPIVESNYDSYAINGTGRYDGIWQFEPRTGVSFNLNENGNINDRRNIVKATNAAMLYFNDLNMMFKQWDVAVGSYNWGPGSMYKAVLSSNQKPGSVNYSTLPLREITANYVPKVIALANIIRNPSKFGVKLMDIPNQPYFTITHPVDNITVANITITSQTDNQSFKILNPQFKNTNYVLNQQAQVLLPIQNQNIYLASASGVSVINNNNTPTKNAQIVDGTAQVNNTSTGPQNNNAVPVAYTDNEQTSNYNNDAINQIGYADSSANANSGLQNAVNVSYSNVNTASSASTTNLATGAITSKVTNNRQTILIVPIQAGEKSTPTSYGADTDGVRKSSTTITTNKMAINDLVANLGYDDNTTNSKPTKKFKKYKNTQLTKKPSNVHYRVSKGDTLYSISKKFDVDVNEIRKTNKLHGNSVKFGQVLIIVRAGNNSKDA